MLRKVHENCTYWRRYRIFCMPNVPGGGEVSLAGTRFESAAVRAAVTYGRNRPMNKREI